MIARYSRCVEAARPRYREVETPIVETVETAARRMQISGGGDGIYAHRVVQHVRLVELDGIAPVVYSDAAKVRCRTVVMYIHVITALLAHATLPKPCDPP